VLEGTGVILFGISRLRNLVEFSPSINLVRLSEMMGGGKAI